MHASRINVGANNLTPIVDPLNLSKTRAGDVNRGEDTLRVQKAMRAGRILVDANNLAQIVDP